MSNNPYDCSTNWTKKYKFSTGFEGPLERTLKLDMDQIKDVIKQAMKEVLWEDMINQADRATLWTDYKELTKEFDKRLNAKIFKA
jgi:N-acetylglutamate synthase/N-acetylornithine aminotransferase